MISVLVVLISEKYAVFNFYFAAAYKLIFVAFLIIQQISIEISC